jgi:D-3-phosphoglycerate dehydrogenase / 2-oxoglutarate reductase
MKKKYKVLITTVPFAFKDDLPLKILESANIEYIINPLNKKLTENELLAMVDGYDGIIAGTELISSKVLNKATKLKHISRVGIGLDSVDLLAARNKGIIVSYTPDAPAPAVAELTIGMMLTLLRSMHVSNTNMHSGNWHRFFGRRLSEVTIGIIGVGRIGSGVIEHLKGFNSPKILANDRDQALKKNHFANIEWVDKDEIYKNADIISVHLPLTVDTKDMIRKEHLLMMKPDAMIINSARGGIINEQDLYDVMDEGHLSGAAIDVFEKEPYDGILKKIERCLLSAHMGSMSIDCRTRMEIEATEEVVRFFNEEPLESEVPEEEYKVQSEGLA